MFVSLTGDLLNAVCRQGCMLKTILSVTPEVY